MNRDFKGVWIPKEIWLDTRLNALDKVILTEIDSLDQSSDGCWASNQYIAEFCQCSPTKVSTSISKLVKFGYLYVKSFDGRKRNLKSRLSNFERQSVKDSKSDSQILKESNTKNNTSNKTLSKRFTPPTVEDVRSYCSERKNNVDAQRFVDHYTAVGWKVGKNPMKDWKAAVRTWERNSYSQKTGPNGIKLSSDRDELDDEIDRILGG